jgi:hypothetical protein
MSDAAVDQHRHAGVTPAWFAPAAVGAAALGTCVLLNVRDPNQPGSWGFCPFKASTGLDCPGCGLLRGTAALTRGDLATALDHNVLIVPILGLLVWAYVRWAAPRFGYVSTARSANPLLVWCAAAAVMVFWVARNLPMLPYLDSGLL